MWLNKPYNASPSASGAFGHEVYHVIQADQSGSFLTEAIGLQAASTLTEYYFGEPFAFDPYSFDPSASILPQFLHGNVEAQGAIVQSMIADSAAHGYPRGKVSSQYQETYDEILRRCRECKKKKKY